MIASCDAQNRLLTPICALSLSDMAGLDGGRAPEILLGQDTYTEAVDMWAVGCIFGELLRHEPLFPAKGEIETLELMTRLLGRPSDRIWPVRAAPQRVRVLGLGFRGSRCCSAVSKEKFLVQWAEPN